MQNLKNKMIIKQVYYQFIFLHRAESWGGAIVMTGMEEEWWALLQVRMWIWSAVLGWPNSHFFFFYAKLLTPKGMQALGAIGDFKCAIAQSHMMLSCCWHRGSNHEPGWRQQAQAPTPCGRANPARSGLSRRFSYAAST